MTSQETFKRRIRARMAKTGERYTAARRVMLAQAADAAEARKAAGRRIWVSPPELSDEAMTSATGKGHDEWADIIEAHTGGVEHHDHPAVARYLEEHLAVSGWWAQSITVSYERITGLRLPYQRSDGSFAATKTTTVDVDAGLLRKMLVDDADRAVLFPGHEATLRSKPESKAIRIGIGPDGASAVIGLTTVDGRTKVAVQHEKLPTYDDVEKWKFYWGEWLGALE